MRALTAGQDPAAVLQCMARALTNKLMHQPSVELRQASYHGRLEVLEVARRILGIGEHPLMKEDFVFTEPTE